MLAGRGASVLTGVSRVRPDRPTCGHQRARLEAPLGRSAIAGFSGLDSFTGRRPCGAADWPSAATGPRS